MIDNLFSMVQTRRKKAVNKAGVTTRGGAVLAPPSQPERLDTDANKTSEVVKVSELKTADVIFAAGDFKIGHARLNIDFRPKLLRKLRNHPEQHQHKRLVLEK